MAEQLNQHPDTSVNKTSQGPSRDTLNDLFRQVTHDIRVPVTGLKMLWPMIDEVAPEERGEIYDYLKTSSYELFELIENLALVLTDHELINDPLEAVDLDEVITTAIAQDDSVMDLLAEDIPGGTFQLRRKHLLNCLKLSLEACHQITEECESSEIEIKGKLIEGTLILQFIGPSIAIKGDKYSTRVQYSLFRQAKGNSKLSGFTMLRLRNLTNLVGGKLRVEINESRTLLQLSLAAN